MRDDSEAPTIKMRLVAEDDAVSRRLTRPVLPMAELALPIAGALLQLPRGTAAALDATGRVPESWLEAILARYALAVVVRAEWGFAQGALRFDANFVWPNTANTTVLRVLFAQGRLLVFTHDEERESVPAAEPRWLLPDVPELVAAAARHSARYSLEWAAAAQTLYALAQKATPQ